MCAIYTKAYSHPCQFEDKEGQRYRDCIMEDRLRRTVRLVALFNLGYFGVEFAVALAIRSVSLFSDSADFLEDASINFLILAALGWSLALRSRVGMALAAIILIPSLATLWTAWEKILVPVPPALSRTTILHYGSS